MQAWWTDLVIGFYVLSNGLRVFSYLPQIIRVARDHTGAQAISLTTWTFWAISNAATGLYAGTVVHDGLLALISFANAACCAIVVGMVLAKRRALRVAAPAHGEQGA